jgi:hypothetical protein
MKRILISGDGYTQSHFQRLSALGFEVIHETEVAPSVFRSLLPTIDAYVLGGSERLDASAIAVAERLQPRGSPKTGQSGSPENRPVVERYPGR